MIPKGRHWSGTILDDLVVDHDVHMMAATNPNEFTRFWGKVLGRMEEPMKHTKVYEVWAFCGQDPENITTIPSGSPFTFANDESEAILKSRIYETIASFKGLDFRFVTIVAKEFGTIKVNR